MASAYMFIFINKWEISEKNFEYDTNMKERYNEQSVLH